MKLKIRFDAFDMREALTDAAVRSVSGLDNLTEEVALVRVLVPAREDRYRESLAPWIDSSGEDSAHDRITVEFDTEAGSARVLRRDGKDESRPALGGFGSTWSSIPAPGIMGDLIAKGSKLSDGPEGGAEMKVERKDGKKWPAYARVETWQHIGWVFSDDEDKAVRAAHELAHETDGDFGETSYPIRVKIVDEATGLERVYPAGEPEGGDR